MQEEKRPYHDGLSFPSANIPGITPESAFTDGYLTALHTMDEAHSRVRIGDDGKASDMNPETEMSPDGCNPVSKDFSRRTSRYARCTSGRLRRCGTTLLFSRLRIYPGDVTRKTAAPGQKKPCKGAYLQFGYASLTGLKFFYPIMISRISRSVSRMPSRPRRATLAMVDSTPFFTIPSPSTNSWPFRYI